MRLLLDSHVLLWALTNSEELKSGLKRVILSRDNNVVVSAATVWEIAIKQQLGKLRAPYNLLEAIEFCEFGSLSISPVHALTAGRLPRHHDDPFDRLLVAQALIENFTLVTRDRRLAAYEVQIINA